MDVPALLLNLYPMADAVFTQLFLSPVESTQEAVNLFA